ncbi:zinc/manganese transport system permease protein [Franzmannia pantelleriensis]|uniref:Zinc/manganese transport system permease protein n=1 Tax=Franzmannia pantelleriensis TaxID=48727 RepID=A0A1G9KNN7_9GAMM|nr:metal ABC transporter permease [Halomonas pantelleriensis]SDL51378.1 zinc/manganese transport system permease protein [Halomonas pantelleriensis]
MLAVIADWLLLPFGYGFMRRALVACLALSLTAPVIGVLLSLRGLSLIGEPLSHAIMPGVAIAYLLTGLSLPWIMLGGLSAGLITVFMASGITLVSGLKSDASMSSLFLTAMALAVLLIFASGSALDLSHLLFGSILTVGHDDLLAIVSTASVVVAGLAIGLRALMVEALDPDFLRVQGARPAWIQGAFMTLVVLSLVVGFQALGTLMAVGLMILPATLARFWSRRLEGMVVVAASASMAASLLGLLLSYHYALPSGPAIVLLLGAGYVFSVIGGRHDSLLSRWRRLPSS